MTDTGRRFRVGDRVHHKESGLVGRVVSGNDADGYSVHYPGDDDQYYVHMDEIEFEDARMAFLTRLQGLLRKFDAEIDCAVCGEDTQDYPLVRFANGEILYWRGINGITASNIMDFEK